MPEDDQTQESTGAAWHLDNLVILKRFEQELRDAEVAAKQAYEKVESLRGIVTNMRRYLGKPEPRSLVREASPAELAYVRADQVARVQHRRVETARMRRREIAAPTTVRDAQYAHLPGEAPKPRGRDAVRQILRETRSTMHVRELVEEAKSRGWMSDVKDPWNALSAAAKRLVSDGEVENVGRARYRYRIDKLPPVEEDEPSSGTPDGSAGSSADGQGRLLAGEGGDT